MASKKNRCLGCTLSSCISECSKYREAADKIWDMAGHYEKLGLFDLADELKQICQDIHTQARLKQEETEPEKDVNK